MLTPDKPTSVGMENALRRAKQMVEIEWMPRDFVPSSSNTKRPDGEVVRFDTFFEPWVTVKGLPYSSCRVSEKYFGYNVSLESFMTSLENPNAAVYRRSLHGCPGRNISCYFGTVCSGFASYVMNLPYRTPCSAWPKRPDVTELDAENIDAFSLCDIVLNPAKHIALITGLKRDESGRVGVITISECTPPRCMERDFTPEQFRHKWVEHGFRVFRFSGLDGIPYTPSRFVPLPGDPPFPEEEPFALLPDLGNRSNYRFGEETPELTVLRDGWETVTVVSPDGKTESFPIPENRTLVYEPKQVGFYQAFCVGKEGRSRETEWYVGGIEVDFDKTVCRAGEAPRVSFRDPDGNPVFHYIVNTEDYYLKTKGFFDEPLSEGIFSPRMPKTPGKYRLMLLAKGKFGIYSSVQKTFEVVE